MKSILQVGENCWCLEQADRIAFLVDGKAVFEAFTAAASLAEKSLLIVGWDIDSRIRISRSGPDESITLGNFLEYLAIKKPELEIHILIWDFPVIYAMDREPLPIFNLDWKTHSRIHFALDGEHPIGACHHQKIVVIDDHLAMAGGFDLSNRRWDTPLHMPDDPRRIDPLGSPYPPFHDVQMLVQGPVATKLGELARQRWFRATGGRPVSPASRKPPWPLSIPPDLQDIPVAIARTEPAYKNRREIREVQQLYLKTIAEAERYIYIENQYLTSKAVLQALLTRLEEKKGPEIIIVLPKSNTGWLEENTMGRLRSLAIQALSDGNIHGRLGIYCPVIKGSEPGKLTEVRVHSKLMIVDDTLLRIGSANLNNRSMGLDTECDLAVEMAGIDLAENAISRLRNRLLAEHLGTSPRKVGEMIARKNSLIKAIESLNGNVHCLEVLRNDSEISTGHTLSEIGLVDPEHPVQLDRMMDRMLIHDEDSDSSLSGKLKLLWFFLAIVFLFCLWRFTPLKEYLDAANLAVWVASFRKSALSWLYVLFGYLVGGLVFFPVTVLIVATSTVFGPISAFFLSLGGSIASAALTFAIGHWLGRNTIRNFAGGRLNNISKQMAQRGVLAVGALRLVPIAPFTLVNLVAGASHIRFRDYLFGTLIGMAPGVAGLTLLTDRLLTFLADPGLLNMLLLVFLLLILVAGGYYLRKRLSRFSPKRGKH
jgi:phospholipase D1/2